ncbi:MAG: serine/threonine-protein kinase [Terriglobia bacterium]
MLKCQSCGTTVTENSRFCSSCGASVASDYAVTAAATAAATAAEPRPASPKLVSAQARPRSSGSRASTSPRTSTSSSGLASEGRFLSGTLLAERYRIVAVLGRGGMGEVYRADDLVLGQPVALKFLPEAAAGKEELLTRFRNEVRTARRVSHSNVCRVYDLGTVDGQMFLSMEYVDGEDLASLLRRIGRIPPDKAVEIARQLCAGLAAAHKEGVLHRDLKPANVMLDGRGRAVMTDFGLAGLVDQIQGADVRSGTPAYMSPEQLAGKEVTAKSDIYSLGLVLYEVFTGKRAFEAETLADLVRIRNERPVSNPSSWVKDLDPAVERVIMRCLEHEPGARPASALAVAAALPGGDPLAAALAAGETPSPEMVAAAGEKEAISPRVAVTAFAVVVVGLAISSLIGARVNALRLMPQPLPAPALEVKAGDIVKSLGYTDRPVDHSAQWYYQTDFTTYVKKHDGARPDWPKILSERPQVLVYAYRQSPVYLDPDGYQGTSITPGIVEFDDPPAIQSGMVNLIVDSQGRLISLEAIPKEFDANPAPTCPLDWKPLFAAAGIDPKELKPAEPQWVELGASDTRAAWTGTWPDSGRPLRVEAAAWRGKPVYFRLIGPWVTPGREEQSNTNGLEHTGSILGVTLVILFLTTGALIARRNYLRGKSELRGALRLGVAVFVIEVAIWVCRYHFIPTLAVFGRFVLAVSTGLFLSGTIGMLYLALEPYVRRHWPQAVVSWSRLTTGRVRDPLVARDVLWGVVLGVVWTVVISIGLLTLNRLGEVPQLPSQSLLTGGRELVGIWLLNIMQCIGGTIEFFFAMFLFRIVLRNKWLATAAFVALWTTNNSLRNTHPEVFVPVWIVVFGIAAYAVTRFGLISLAVAIFTANVLLNVPYTFDFSNWYATSALAVVLSFVAIAGWGFYTSLGGQRLFREDLFQ